MSKIDMMNVEIIRDNERKIVIIDHGYETVIYDIDCVWAGPLHWKVGSPGPHHWIDVRRIM